MLFHRHAQIRTLDWNFDEITPFLRLAEYTRLARCSKLAADFAYDLCDLALIEDAVADYSKEEVAACVLRIGASQATRSRARGVPTRVLECACLQCLSLIGRTLRAYAQLCT